MGLIRRLKRNGLRRRGMIRGYSKMGTLTEVERRALKEAYHKNEEARNRMLKAKADRKQALKIELRKEKYQKRNG